MAELTVDQAESQLCPWQMMGECRYDENCAYIHGNTCDMCGQPILHPYHEKQRKEHTKVTNHIVIDIDEEIVKLLAGFRNASKSTSQRWSMLSRSPSPRIKHAESAWRSSWKRPKARPDSGSCPIATIVFA